VSAAAIVALGPGEELIDPATFAETFSNVPRGASLGSALLRAVRPVAEASPVAEHAPDPAALEAAIDLSRSRALATSLAVRLARTYCEAAAVFVSQRGIVRAIAAEGGSGRHETALFLGTMPSVFSRVAASHEPYRGAPPDRTLERRVLRALGRESVEEMAVLPIPVGDRVRMLLYADNGRELVSDGSFAALSVLARRLGRTYERLILSRRV
jgi:hypothetical protein